MKLNTKARRVTLSSAVPQSNRKPLGLNNWAGTTNGARPLLTYLRGVINSLNPTERLIADCILADPGRVINSSIAEVKSRSGASVGSIVGFCRRMGLKGFAEFKIALAQDLAQSGLPGMQGPQGGSVAEKVFHSHAQSLIEALQANPASAFDRATEMLERARRIEFFSIGLSYPVAYTAASKFALLGFLAAAETDSHMQLIKATQLHPGDLAFGISCSGASRETVQCLEVAKAKGAITLSLTNAMKSPITKFSDLSLYATPSEINYFQSPLASRVTQLAVIDALFVGLALKHRSKTSARVQESRQELFKKRRFI